MITGSTYSLKTPLEKGFVSVAKNGCCGVFIVQSLQEYFCSYSQGHIKENSNLNDRGS